MDLIKTLAYAGLGLTADSNEKLKEKFDALVEAGKKADGEGKNIIGDFFKTMDATKEDIEANFDKNKDKLMEQFPVLKELEDKFNKTKEDVTSKFNDTKADLTEKAKNVKEDITSKAKTAQEDITNKVKATTEDLTQKAKTAKEDIENKVSKVTKTKKTEE